MFNLFDSQEQLNPDENYTFNSANPIIGGDPADLKHVKTIDEVTGQEMNATPVKNKNFGQTGTQHWPDHARAADPAHDPARVSPHILGPHAGNEPVAEARRVDDAFVAHGRLRRDEHQRFRAGDQGRFVGRGDRQARHGTSAAAYGRRPSRYPDGRRDHAALVTIRCAKRLLAADFPPSRHRSGDTVRA